MKATPVRAVPVLGLVMVKVSVLTPPTAIGLGEKALARLGGAKTVRVSELVLPAAGAKVGDPHPVVVAFGVAATCKPAGNESVKATPVRATAALGLVMVKVSVLTPPTAMGLGEKALAMLGGAAAVRVSEPVFPVPPLVEVTLPVVLALAPLVVAVTATVTVQVPLAAMVPPEKLKEVFPAAGAKVGDPHPVVVAFGVAATCRPAGNESVKATPVRAVPVLGLVMVKVSVLTPPTAMGLGEKALAMLGGAATVRVSEPVLPVPPLVEVTLPVVLTLAPAVVAVTATVTVQVPLAAMVPPEKLREVLPAAGARVAIRIRLWVRSGAPPP